MIANSPYYQALGAMALRKGLVLGPSFNSDYDDYLPQAKGHILLIETQNEVPIIDLKILERYFPNASHGLKTGSITIGETKIYFVDFANSIKEFVTH